MDPLFEAKIQSIINVKQRTKQLEGEDDSDSEAWESDDDEPDVDANEFDEKLQNLDGKETDGTEPKKIKLDVDQESPEAVAKAATAAEMEKARKREMDRVFSETTALPPVGCLDPKEVTQSDLIGVLALVGQTLRPIVVSGPLVLPLLLTWLAQFSMILTCV